MPRGFQRDNTETAARNFDDPRSFIALGCGCEILYGKDKTARRKKIWERAHGRCEVQSSPACRGFASWEDSDPSSGWHHTYAHGKKCDCLDDAAKWSCGPCHRHEHCARNPRWTNGFGKSNKSAVEVSNVISPEA